MTFIKFALLFKTALMTFCLGLLGAFVWLSAEDGAPPSPLAALESRTIDSSPAKTRIEKKVETYEMPDLSFCELAKNPAAFDGKIIRLRGVFARTPHGPLLTDDECFDAETTTWVKTTEGHWKEIGNLSLKTYKIETSDDLNITAVGKFEKNIPTPNENGIILSSDSHEHRAKFRFELIKIEKVARPLQK